MDVVVVVVAVAVVVELYVHLDSPLSLQPLFFGTTFLHLESLMKEKSVHHKKQSFLTRTVTGVKKPKFDRRHHITAQIDAIRAEQADKLYAKEQARKKKLANIGVLDVARTFTINPKSSWKQTWDLGILVLVIFSAVYIPVVLALPDMTGVPAVLQASFDFAFLLDFFMCFRTGFVRPDNEIELNQAKIVQHYLGSWFTIDILASFPLDYILVLFNCKLMVCVICCCLITNTDHFLSLFFHNCMSPFCSDPRRKNESDFAAV